MRTNLLFYTDGEKKKARTELAYLRADIYDTASYSKQLCENITALNEYKNADTLLLYFPTKTEPDLTALAKAAWRDGKSVAFPISKTESLTLDFRIVNDLCELREGAYGIFEPDNAAEHTIISKNTLCIVPALAVDIDGFRLGYGKGYYDRFLSSFCGRAAVAIHSSLVCERLPRNDTDIPLKIIITEQETLRK